MIDLSGRFLNSSNCAAVVAEQLRSEGFTEEQIEAGLHAAREERAQWTTRSAYGDPAYGRRFPAGEKYPNSARANPSNQEWPPVDIAADLEVVERGRSRGARERIAWILMCCGAVLMCVAIFSFWGVWGLIAYLGAILCASLMLALLSVERP